MHWCGFFVDWTLFKDRLNKHSKNALFLSLKMLLSIQGQHHQPWFLGTHGIFVWGYSTGHPLCSLFIFSLSFMYHVAHTFLGHSLLHERVHLLLDGSGGESQKVRCVTTLQFRFTPIFESTCPPDDVYCAKGASLASVHTVGWFFANRHTFYYPFL